MAVENPLYINEFNAAWPDGLDPKSQGDDHIRNIKAAIKRTFPKVTGPTQATQQDLDKLTKAGVTNVPGMVMMWPYDLASIPAGWKVCNGVGQISTGRPVPNLRDRFIVGAGASYTIGAIGGDTQHGHVVTINGTALTEAQLPPHSHEVGVGPYTPDGVDTQGSITEPRNVVNYPGTHSNWKTSTKGSGAPHTHGSGVSIQDHRPPYYALFYIIKD